MRRFLLRVLLFCGMIGVFVLVIIMPQYSQTYNAAIIDKYERLISIEEAKIVVVGDSNVPFGIDSELIQNELGMPVVNMGLHGGLRQTMHTDFMKDEIGAGDIIIIAPSNFGYKDGVGDPILAWVTIENYFPLWKTIRVKDYPPMIKFFPTYLNRASKLFLTGKGNLEPEGSIYRRSAYNIYGDVAHPRTQNFMENGFIPNDGFQVGQIEDELINYWNAYHNYAVSKGATLYMSCPPILEEDFKMTAEELKEFQVLLQSKLNFPVIANFDQYVLSKKYFYDTNYHLNDEGVQIRTNLLIDDIERALKKG